MKSETRSKKTCFSITTSHVKKKKIIMVINFHTHTHTILFILAVKNDVVGRSCRIMSVEGGEYYIYSSA